MFSKITIKQTLRVHLIVFLLETLLMEVFPLKVFLEESIIQHCNK